ncbi:MAG: hypothetical protein RLZZ50_2064 [Verrucomicrobiota bacterium]
MAPLASFSPLRHPSRGGIFGWLVATLVFCAALGAIAWMLLLPAVAQTRFAAATGGAELRVLGLMGDPFSGRATVTGWTLRASPSSTAPVLARGGASEIIATRWQAALAADPETGVAFIDSLTLRASELILAPDAKGRWPLLALGASAGLPYERGGKIGDGPRVRVKLLRLSVDTVIVRDSSTGRDTPVRIGWRGEFKDLDHSRPIVAALLAAAAGKTSTH